MIKALSAIARLGVVLVLVAPAMLCAPTRDALAQEQLLIEPGSAVPVSKVPPVGSKAKAPLRLHRHMQDPEALKTLKAEHKTGGGGVVPEALAGVASTGPTVLGKIPGLQQPEGAGFYPPDSQVAAGPAHIAEAVNLQVRIWTKDSPPVLVTTFDIGDFLSFLGVDDSILTDPKLRFDPQSGRWFLAVIAYPVPTGAFILAVSTSDDPTGEYNVYVIPSKTGTVPDFTAMGMSDDKVVLSANAFQSTGAESFKGTEFVVLNKSELVAGAQVHGQFYGPPQGLFTIQPAHTLPSTTGSTTTLYMAAVAFNSATSMRVWSLTGVPGVGAGVKVKTTNLKIPKLTSPPNAEQADSTNLIVTNDNSILDAVVRNGSLWVAANSACKPAGDTAVRACLRFMQVNTGTKLGIAQAFDVGAVGWYYYYPAIQVDGADNLLSAFSGSSSSTFASVYVGGQPAGETNMFSTPLLIKAGKTAYEKDRWGDYSGAGIDSSDATVWIAGELTRDPTNWGTHIAEIGF